MKKTMYLLLNKLQYKENCKGIIVIKITTTITIYTTITTTITTTMLRENMTTETI